MNLVDRRERSRKSHDIAARAEAPACRDRRASWRGAQAGRGAAGAAGARPARGRGLWAGLRRGAADRQGPRRSLQKAPRLGRRGYHGRGRERARPLADRGSRPRRAARRHPGGGGRGGAGGGGRLRCHLSLRWCLGNTPTGALAPARGRSSERRAPLEPARARCRRKPGAPIGDRPLRGAGARAAHRAQGPPAGGLRHGRCGGPHRQPALWHVLRWPSRSRRRRSRAIASSSVSSRPRWLGRLRHPLGWGMAHHLRNLPRHGHRLRGRLGADLSPGRRPVQELPSCL